MKYIVLVLLLTIMAICVGVDCIRVSEVLSARVRDRNGHKLSWYRRRDRGARRWLRPSRYSGGGYYYRRDNRGYRNRFPFRFENGKLVRNPVRTRAPRRNPRVRNPRNPRGRNPGTARPNVIPAAAVTNPSNRPKRVESSRRPSN
ncbi:polyribonucleotide nucleotidyltransferase [Acrasis kona]|uniref:Polyribonucleotide nucleotidyltransferase n=1 Tax=Acrasis kona TaxID=1008807 RepID=A0AAW2ZSB8_9EUKA